MARLTTSTVMSDGGGGRSRLHMSDMLKNNPSIRFNQDSSDIQKLSQSTGLVDRFDMDWFNKFSRFPVMDPYNAITGTREYVFFTKPDLCILDRTRGRSAHQVMSNNAFFLDAIDRYYPVAMQLQSSARNSNKSPFMNILTNNITSPLDLPGISANMVETGANIMGTKISYRSTSMQSDEDFDFTVEYEDNKYLDVYMLFKMWDEYEKLKWNGALDFTLDEHWADYIVHKVLHDQISIYKFIVADDGYRILYFARLTGCIPTSIPRDAFSEMANDGVQKISVGWKAHFVRDMDPVILYHFNTLTEAALRTTSREAPVFDQSINRVNGQWCTIPYVDMRTVSDKSRGYRTEYYLRWRI